MNTQAESFSGARTCTGTLRRLDEGQGLWYIDPEQGGPQVTLSLECHRAGGGAVFDMVNGARIIYELAGEDAREVGRVVMVNDLAVA